MSILVEKIHEEARAKANSTLEEGGKKAAEIIKQAEGDINIFKAECMKETIALREDILRRRNSVANLEVKKLMLAAKKEKLDEVYDSALKALAALPAEKYLALIGKMLTSASDGDVIKIAKKDANLITESFVESEGKKRGITLTLAKEYADIAGGIIICGKDFDKNLSLDAELVDLREETESTIAKQLFGEF